MDYLSQFFSLLFFNFFITFALILIKLTIGNIKLLLEWIMAKVVLNIIISAIHFFHFLIDHLPRYILWHWLLWIFLIRANFLIRWMLPIIKSPRFKWLLIIKILTFFSLIFTRYPERYFSRSWLFKFSWNFWFLIDEKNTRTFRAFLFDRCV